MQIIPLLAVALVVADAVSASLQPRARHPARHLFQHERRGPVELYKGDDPQLEMVKRARANAPQNIHLRRRHADFYDVMEHAPADLAKRQASTTSPGTGTAYPPAGSDAPAANTLPQAWVDKYNAVKQQGLIPDIPPSTENAAGTVDYPSGTDLSKVCNWSTQKCNDGDIYQAPDNSVALGIDDGPTPDGTPDYLDILSQYNVSATHFLIGSAISWNMPTMKQLAQSSPLQHLAVHTWSHTLQTTKTDLEVLGDLGWTMQIIYDISGYIPAYWRPPEGDVDNRVRAIAKYVFGMQTVMWTHDADDWCLRQGTGTATTINSCVESAPNLKTVRANQVAWAQPKTNNTGWISLNHETTDQAAKAFKSLIKAIKKNTWNLEGAVPNLQGLPWYGNAYGPTDTPTKPDNILPTRDIINVTDDTAAKGSSSAPKLGNWAKTAAVQNPSIGAQATGSNSSGSSSSSKSSGAMSLVQAQSAAVVLLTVGLAAAVTLVV